jgi:hypothetical protein
MCRAKTPTRRFAIMRLWRSVTLFKMARLVSRQALLCLTRHTCRQRARRAGDRPGELLFTTVSHQAVNVTVPIPPTNQPGRPAGAAVSPLALSARLGRRGKMRHSQLATNGIERTTSSSQSRLRPTVVSFGKIIKGIVTENPVVSMFSPFSSSIMSPSAISPIGASFHGHRPSFGPISPPDTSAHARRHSINTTMSSSSVAQPRTHTRASMENEPAAASGGNSSNGGSMTAAPLARAHTASSARGYAALHAAAQGAQADVQLAADRYRQQRSAGTAPGVGLKGRPSSASSVRTASLSHTPLSSQPSTARRQEDKVQLQLDADAAVSSTSHGFAQDMHPAVSNVSAPGTSLARQCKRLVIAFYIIFHSYVEILWCITARCDTSDIALFRKLHFQLGPSWQHHVFRHVRNYDVTASGRIQPVELQRALQLAGANLASVEHVRLVHLLSTEPTALPDRTLPAAIPTTGPYSSRQGMIDRSSCNYSALLSPEAAILAGSPPDPNCTRFSYHRRRHCWLILFLFFRILHLCYRWWRGLVCPVPSCLTPTTFHTAQASFMSDTHLYSPTSATPRTATRATRASPTSLPSNPVATDSLGSATPAAQAAGSSFLVITSCTI